MRTEYNILHKGMSEEIPITYLDACKLSDLVNIADLFFIRFSSIVTISKMNELDLEDSSLLNAAIPTAMFLITAQAIPGNSIIEIPITIHVDTKDLSVAMVHMDQLTNKDTQLIEDSRIKFDIFHSNLVHAWNNYLIAQTNT